MGIALIKMKVMPESPETNLEELQSKIEATLQEKKANKISFEIEPVAFGLKAIIASFAIDESQGLDPIEQQLGSLKNVSSVQVVDMRRAFG